MEVLSSSAVVTEPPASRSVLPTMMGPVYDTAPALTALWPLTMTVSGTARPICDGSRQEKTLCGVTIT
jgi:hypothetical protein